MKKKDKTKVFIPSYGRAEVCITHYMLDGTLDWCYVVPESQEADYVDVVGKEHVVAISDDRDGSISRKRNAVLEMIPKGEFGWMIDDDLERVYRIKGEEYDPQMFAEYLEMMELVVMDADDIGMCGVAVSSDPVKYAEYKPFSLTKQMYGAVGLKRVWQIGYDEDLTSSEDADLCLQYAYRGYRMLRDNRIFCQFRQEATQGGVSGSRKEGDKRLQDKWGAECVKLDSSGIVKSINIPVRGI